MTSGSIHRTASRDSVISLPGSINTKRGYKEFCKSLYQPGITPKILRENQKEILNICDPQNATTSSQVADDSSFEDQTQLLVIGQATSNNTRRDIAFLTTKNINTNRDISAVAAGGINSWRGVHGPEVTKLSFELFSNVFEGIAVYMHSAEKVKELIRYRRTLEEFRRELEVENIVYDNIWCILRSRAGVLVKTNMNPSTTVITEVLSYLQPSARQSFVNACNELVITLSGLETMFQKYGQNLVSKDYDLVRLYH